MLSRLSDLAKGVNTVLQDLSGEDDGNATNASQGAVSSINPRFSNIGGGSCSSFVIQVLGLGGDFYAVVCHKVILRCTIGI